jgi:hypothetical protein
MPRKLVFALLLAALPAPAAIWPDKLGTFERKSASELVSQSSLAEEYGREGGEQADYGQFQVMAVRYKDSTGAYAASLEEHNHPLQVGNYLVTCSGTCPPNLAALADKLPRMVHAPLPVLQGYFPPKNQVPASARYIMGPGGLHDNLPQISSGAVGLDFGTEGQVARYRLGNGEAALAIFSYPTLEMARQQAPVYERIAGVQVKRTGALVALVAPAPGAQPIDPADAKKLLSEVNYQASVAWNEPLPLVIKPETAADMMLGIMTLAGIVVGFCLVSGLVFAGTKLVAKRFGYSGADGSMTTLHLGGK